MNKLTFKEKLTKMASTVGFTSLAEYSIPVRRKISAIDHANAGNSDKPNSPNDRSTIRRNIPAIEHTTPGILEQSSPAIVERVPSRRENGLERATPAIVKRTPSYTRQMPIYEAVNNNIEYEGEEVDNTVVCQAAINNDGTCYDGCYTGCETTLQTLQVEGVTLDSSSSDAEMRLNLLRSSNMQNVTSERELRAILRQADLQEQELYEQQYREQLEQLDEDLQDVDSDIESDDDSQQDLEESDVTQPYVNGTDASSTSSLSCDGDSVIYVGQREAFKGVEELVVTAEESLCVQKTESAASLEPVVPQQAYFSPPSLELPTNTANCQPPQPRSNSADSGVCSQPETSPVTRRALEPSIYAVVAIDLGTTHSGYAYSVCREPGRQVHVMRRWEGGDSGLVNHKTPTALLLTPSAAFHAFGSAARDFFHDLPTQEARRWLFFERFKMVLHRDTELHRDTPIPASNGKTQPALVVFAHSLRHFMNLALRELSERCADQCAVSADNVRWVVTVPAIWRQPARQLIREAAYQAGLCSVDSADRLLIVLEPEAAAVQCREQVLQSRDSMCSENGSVPSTPEPLSEAPVRFLVADCGGGTVDITLHELSGEDGSLKELLPATGGPYGSTGIDKEFEALLAALFGADLMAQFKERRPAAHAELLLAFEGRKRSVGPQRDHPVNLFPPYAFIDFFRKHSGKDVEYAIKKNGRRDITWCREGMLRFQSTAVLQLFKSTVQHVLEHVGEVLDDPVLSDQVAQYLFLVGGFSESEVLQKAVKNEFGDRIQVISPQPSSLATLRGAVLYGLDTGVISARRAKHSYGVGVLKRFVPGLHPASKLVVSRDGARWCADVLDCFVTAGQRLSPGHAETRRYVAARSGQSAAVLNIYCAPASSMDPSKPQFVTDAGVSRCGTLTLSLDCDEESGDSPQLGIRKIDPQLPPDTSRPAPRREVTAHMLFSGTELVVSAVDTHTGKCVRVDVDFLAGD